MRRIIFLFILLLIPLSIYADCGGMGPGPGLVAGVSCSSAPTLTSATVPSSGGTLVLVFNMNVSVGSGGSAGWAVSFSTAGAETLTYSSGSGSTTLTYTLSTLVMPGETVTAGLTYTQPTNGIQCGVGYDLVSISSPFSVTNNSTAEKFYSTTADGDIVMGFSGWDGQHDSTQGTLLYGGAVTTAAAAWTPGAVWTGTGMFLFRDFLYFATGTIPDGDVVDDVKLYVYRTSPSGTYCGTQSIMAFAGTQSDTLNVLDFDNYTGAHTGGDESASAISDVASGSCGNWSVMTFNAAGRAIINKTGTTKICLREYEHDVLDVSIGTTEIPAGMTGTTFADSPTNKPYIIVSHHTP